MTDRHAGFARFVFASFAASLFSLSASGQGLEASLVEDLEWREIGPSAFGGRIIDFEVPESDRWTIYAAAASGGLWRSRSHGTSWECIFQHESSISIGDIALDPKDPEVIWVGTGEANNQRSSYWGDGVYKTTDGGQTWTNTGLRDSQHVGRIVVHPSDSDVVYVAALGSLYSPNEQRGLYKTGNGGQTWTKVLGIDEDVGVVDVVLDAGDPEVVYAASYERRRRAWDFDGAGPGSAIWKSADAGASWKRLEGGLPDGEIGRIGLDVSRTNPGTVYATVSNQNPRPPEAPEGGERPRFGVSVEAVEGGLSILRVSEDTPASRAGLKVDDLLVAMGEAALASRDDLRAALSEREVGDDITVKLRRGGEEMEVTVSLTSAPARESRRGGGQIGGEVYKSEDQGETWTKVNESAVGGSPAYYYGQIRVDPSNDQNLYIMSVPVHHSKDGGKTWEQGNFAGSVHVDNHALWVDPQDGRHLLLGNDGGLAITFDGGEHWDHVNNLPLAQFYAIEVDDRMPYWVYGGTQDNGTWMGPSMSRSSRGVTATSWRNIGGGDGFVVEVVPADNDVVYLESQFGAVQRVDTLVGGSSSIRPPRGEEGASRFNWMSPIEASPHAADVVYFAGEKLFKSYDRGASWHTISPDLTTQNEDKIGGNVPHCTITTIAESPLQPDRLLVGTDDGNVQWSDDGGRQWVNCAGLFAGLPPRLWCSRVEFSHHDADTAFVSFTGYREDDRAVYVFRTTDAGNSFDSIAGDLPPGGVNVVREDPRNRDLWFVGTEFGAFASLDGGGHWVELSSGIPTTPVHDLVIHERDQDLVAGTHGRGMWVLDIAALEDLDREKLAGDAYLCHPQTAVSWQRMSTQAGGFSGDRPWRAPNPASGANFYFYLGADHEEGQVELSVQDSGGDLVRGLEPPRDRGLHRVSWDLAARRQEGEDAPEGGRRGGRGRGGARAAPGTYTAVLVVDGEEHRRSFEVIADPISELRSDRAKTRLR